MTYKATPLPLIVTGTGRCGTGFISKFLTSAGVPCGHETIFSTGGLEQAKINRLYRTDLVGDSSWLAAPYLDSDLLKDAFVVHLVRHPRKQIASALKLRRTMASVNINRYLVFQRKIMPELAEYDNEIDELVFRYIAWNRTIERYCKGRQFVTFNIEREPFELLEILSSADVMSLPGVDTSTLFDDRAYNAKSSTNVRWSLDQVSNGGMVEELTNLALEYGYEWDDDGPIVPPVSAYINPRDERNQLRDAKNKPGVVIQKPRAAIKAVITTLDNLSNLKESVAVLLGDELVDEIVVVNNGSEDGTREWLDGQNGIMPIHRENKGAGPGRNDGVDMAGEFDYVLLLDGGIRPLHGGTKHLLDYLEMTPACDVIGVEIVDFETDAEKAWRRWPDPIEHTYANTRLSHTAYCLARRRAFDGIRFCEDGPFGEPGWGADDDEMAYRWAEAGVVVHVVTCRCKLGEPCTGVHPYRRASGSFRRLFADTGIWPNQFGSVYEKRVVWLEQNWPQYQPGEQWGEPWLTLVVKDTGDVDKAARTIKAAHDLLMKRRFEKPWHRVPNPYSVVLWCPDPDSPTLDWAEPRRLRRHEGNTTIVNGKIVRRDESNEETWTGNFRVWAGDEWKKCVRKGAFYHTVVSDEGEAMRAIDTYNELHPTKKSRLETPPGRMELGWQTT